MKKKLKMLQDKFRKLDSLHGVFIVLILFLGLTSAYLYNENQTHQSNYQNTKSQLIDLQGDYENLESSLDLETSKYQDALDEQDSLKSSYDKLDTKYQKSQTKISELEKQVAELNKQIETLKAQLVTPTPTPTPTHAPAPASTSTYDSSNTGSSGGGTVWISATGSKYHSIPNCGNMNPNTASQMSRAQAEASGYGACKKCW